MARFSFRRETHTPHSDCWTVLEAGAVVGRLDIHYAGVAVHATLNISVDMAPDAVKILLGDIDTELLDAVGIVRQNTIVHVHQGHDLGVYNTSGLTDPGTPESARESVVRG